MAYPDTLPSFTNPLASDPRVGHATLHGAVNDALEEVAAWVASNSPRKATVTLSSADILALHTTPVQLVAAPGAGKVLAPMHAILSYTFGTVSYNETGSSPTWGFPSGSTYTNLGTIGASISNGQTSTQVVRPDSGFFCYPNEAIGMTVNAALTDGDYPVTITVWYSIEDVP